MEMVTIFEQFISDLGFPIAVCIALFLVLNKQSERHKEEMKLMTEALNNNTTVLDNNTKVLEKFLFKIGGEPNESL